MSGITDYFQALRLIFHRRVFIFAIIPAIFAFVFSGFVFVAVHRYSDHFGTRLSNWYVWEWGREAFQTGTTWLSGAVMIVLALILFKYVVLIVSSPFMSFMSERIESVLTGHSVSSPFSFRLMGRGFLRGLRITFRNLFRELAISLLLLILSFFPFFTPFTGALLLATQAYFAGFGNMDFTMERYYSIPESVRFVRAHKVYTLANGLVFIGLLFIPVVGAVFAVSLGAAAATIGVVDRLPVGQAEIFHDDLD